MTTTVYIEDEHLSLLHTVLKDAVDYAQAEFNETKDRWLGIKEMRVRAAEHGLLEAQAALALVEGWCNGEAGQVS